MDLWDLLLCFFTGVPHVHLQHTPLGKHHIMEVLIGRQLSVLSPSVTGLPLHPFSLPSGSTHFLPPSYLHPASHYTHAVAAWRREQSQTPSFFQISPIQVLARLTGDPIPSANKSSISQNSLPCHTSTGIFREITTAR